MMLETASTYKFFHLLLLFFTFSEGNKSLLPNALKVLKKFKKQKGFRMHICSV